MGAPKDKLTDKQIRFVEEYLKDLDAKNAAVRAGYSEKTAYAIGFELKNKPLVKAAIEAAVAARAERNKVTADEVIAGFREIFTRCMQREQVFDSEGNPTGEWKFDGTNANRAAENLGKHIGLFKETSEQKHSGEIKLTILDYTSKKA